MAGALECTPSGLTYAESDSFSLDSIEPAESTGTTLSPRRQLFPVDNTVAVRPVSQGGRGDERARKPMPAADHGRMGPQQAARPAWDVNTSKAAMAALRKEQARRADLMSLDALEQHSCAAMEALNGEAAAKKVVAPYRRPRRSSADSYSGRLIQRQEFVQKPGEPRRGSSSSATGDTARAAASASTVPADSGPAGGSAAIDLATFELPQESVQDNEALSDIDVDEDVTVLQSAVGHSMETRIIGGASPGASSAASWNPALRATATSVLHSEEKFDAEAAGYCSAAQLLAERDAERAAAGAAAGTRRLAQSSLQSSGIGGPAARLQATEESDASCGRPCRSAPQPAADLPRAQPARRSTQFPTPALSWQGGDDIVWPDGVTAPPRSSRALSVRPEHLGMRAIPGLKPTAPKPAAPPLRPAVKTGTGAKATLQRQGADSRGDRRPTSTPHEADPLAELQQAVSSVQRLQDATLGLRQRAEQEPLPPALSPASAATEASPAVRPARTAAPRWARVCAWLRPAAGPAFLSAKPEGRVLRARLGPHVADFREFAFDKVLAPGEEALQQEAARLTAAVAEGRNAAAFVLGRGNAGTESVLHGGASGAGLMNLAVRQLLEQTAPEAGGHGVGAPGQTSQPDSDGDCVSAEEAQEEAQATELHVAAFRLAGERITDLLCAPGTSAGGHDVVHDASSGRAWVPGLVTLAVRDAADLAAVQAVLLDARAAQCAAAGAAADAAIVATVFVTSGAPAAIAAASAAFAAAAAAPAGRAAARPPPYTAPPTGARVAKLTFVELPAAEAGSSSHAGRTGLVGLARQLAAAPPGRGTALPWGAEQPTVAKRGSGGAADNVQWVVSEVVWAAARGHGVPVPWRLSRLTRYLQDTLQPTGCALVVACVDPSEAAQPASMATLATVARLLRTKRA